MLQEQEDSRAIESHTEDEDDIHSQSNDTQGEEESMPVEYPGTVIPDTNVETIEADNMLTNDYDLETDYIDLIHLKISSLKDLDLGKFKNLESLCLRQNLIQSMVEINEVSDKLEELDFYDNRINHISSNIGGKTNLKSLDLSFNKIKNIKNLDKLINLESLYLIQNKIREIKNLENNKKLKVLELGGNKIEEISETMNSLIDLKEIWLGKNKITQLKNFNHLTNLTVISIQSNNITKIEGLENLENLEEFYISHNKIETIEGLENNKNLQILDVSANKITKLDNLNHLTKLTDFWCSYNKVDNFDEIGKLSKLPELDTVYFEGNPIQFQNPTAYRRKVKLYLGPSLTKIDATYLQ